MTEDFKSDKHEEGMTGVGGFYYFKLRPNQIGKTTFRLIHKRSWETNPISKINVNIIFIINIGICLKK